MLPIKTAGADEKRKADRYRRNPEKQEEKKEEKWSEIEEYLAEMESDMDGVPFDDFSFMKEELCEKKEEEYSFDAHRKLLKDYTKK